MSKDFLDRIASWGLIYADQAIRVSASLSAEDAQERIAYMRARLIHLMITSVEERSPDQPPEFAENFALLAAEGFDHRIAELGWAVSGGGTA